MFTEDALSEMRLRGVGAVEDFGERLLAPVTRFLFVLFLFQIWISAHEYVGREGKNKPNLYCVSKK